jgi:hypothetical protein
MIVKNGPEDFSDLDQKLLGGSLSVKGRELEKELLRGNEGTLFFASCLTFGPPSVDATFEGFRTRIMIVS